MGCEEAGWGEFVFDLDGILCQGDDVRATPVVLTTNYNLIDSNKFSSLLEYFNLLIFTGKLLVNIFLLQ